MPSSSASRVAIRRIFTALVSAGALGNASRFPEPNRAQHVAAFLGLDVEPLADRTRPDGPCQENGGRIVDECLLNAAHSRADFVVRGGVAEAIESAIDGGVAEPTPVERSVRMPHQVWAHKRRAADQLRQDRL